MKESIGKTIRRLRKERGLTQEELAERLNITSQAVSKWESESGMPDISQIVPLASVFGVSTDVLFGLDTTTEESEAWEIVEKAHAMERYGQRETYLAAYDELCRGLKKYPSNLVLLNVCMGLGTSLSLPDNGWIYDPERGGADRGRDGTHGRADRRLLGEYDRDFDRPSESGVSASGSGGVREGRRRSP